MACSQSFSELPFQLNPLGIKSKVDDRHHFCGLPLPNANSRCTRPSVNALSLMVAIQHEPKALFPLSYRKTADVAQYASTVIGFALIHYRPLAKRELPTPGVGTNGPGDDLAFPGTLEQNRPVRIAVATNRVIK
jgi:hypothetical protein